MAQKDKMEDFIEGLFKGKKHKIPKQQILDLAAQAQFAADVMVFFKQLPDQSYDEAQLVEQLNTIIDIRGRAEAIGGLLRIRARA